MPAQALLTIALASVVMIADNPLLALVALLLALLIGGTASRYNRISRPAQQEVQQRIAELTAEAEENVSGIRIVKAFAREEHQLHRFQRSVARVFDQSIYSTKLQAFFSPLIGLLPQIGIALILLVGRREVINGSLSTGSFVAFRCRTSVSSTLRARMPSPCHFFSHSGKLLRRSRGSRYSDHGPCSATYRRMPRTMSRPYDREVSTKTATCGMRAGLKGSAPDMAGMQTRMPRISKRHSSPSEIAKVDATIAIINAAS